MQALKVLRLLLVLVGDLSEEAEESSSYEKPSTAQVDPHRCVAAPTPSEAEI
jgi:hypothetical protein